MLKRTITGVAMAVVILPCVIFSDTYAFPALLALLSGIGVYELHSCIGMKKLPFLIASLPVAVALPLCARLYYHRFLDLAEMRFFNFTHKVVMIYMFYLLISAVFSKGKNDIEKTAMVFLTTFYISISFSCIVLLRDYEFGVHVFVLVFAGPWISDIFAYLIGRWLGRHKLIPDVSPKKTVEGAIGGLVAGVLMFVIYGLVLEKVTDISVNYFGLVIAGFVMSLISQCGDLVFSLIKRKYGIKDYGKLLPGHGGVMDRFDSVIAAAPFILILFDLSSIFKLFS